MATPNERLHRVNTLPTSGYEVGGVYFVRSEGKIYIRTESGWECYGASSGGSNEKQWVITSETTEIDASIWDEMKSFNSTTTSIPNIKFVDEFNHAFSVRGIRQNGSFYEILFTSQYADYPQDLGDATAIFMSCNMAIIGAPKNGKCSVETACNEVDLGTLIIDSTSSKVSSIKINGTTKTPDSNGIVDLGTISGGGSVTTDTSMSATSTNPVQNKVIKSYMDSLVGTAITQLAQI